MKRKKKTGQGNTNSSRELMGKRGNKSRESCLTFALRTGKRDVPVLSQKTQ